jgi:fumarylpyruvate hydrolase
MIKCLFNVTRPTVPIFVRSSKSGVAADAGAAPVEFDSRRATRGESEDCRDGVVAAGARWARSDREFPVRRVYCVGRNYREHAIEMGCDPDAEPPFFFQKPADAVVVCDPTATSSLVVPYPTMTSSLHHEGELVVAIGTDGLRVRVEDAMDHVYGYAVGCDLTRRDLQDEAPRAGRPWDTAKGFDGSCPVSPIVPRRDVELSGDTGIELVVNGSVRQRSALGCMIHSVPEIVSNLSHFFALRRGDLILTGTPAGVSRLIVGDSVSITCGDLIPCRFVVGEPE